MKTKSPNFIFLRVFIIIIMFTNLVYSQWTSDPNVNLNVCDLNNSQTLPKISPTSDGGCFICWFDNRGNGQYKVYLQRLNANGQKQFASDGLLVSDKPQNSFLGDYDMKTDANDNAVIVFSDKRNSPGDTILNPFAYKISSTGQFLWGPDGVTISTSTSAYQVWPKTAVLTDGSVIVVWWYINSAQRNSWVTMQKLNSAGVPQFASPINIQDPGGKRYQYPDVVQSENGSYILSWVYGPKDTVGSFIPDNVTIFTNKCDANGNLMWGAGHKVVYTNTGNHVPIYSVPKIYPDGNGGALYSYFTTEGNGIYSSAQRFDSFGNNLFPANGSMSAISNQYFHVEPYLAYMPGTDETFLFWTEADAATQSHQAIYGQKYSSTGARLWGDNGKGFSVLDTASIYGISCFAKDTNVVVAYADGNFSGIGSILKGFRVGRSGGYSWNSEPILSNVASGKDYISGAFTPAGMTILTWEDTRNSGSGKQGGIYAQNLNYNGSLGPVGITQISSLVPDDFTLHQNYPNPFNNSTTIEFDIKLSGTYMLEIYNNAGQKMGELMNEQKSPGSYRINYNAEKLSSGIFYYKLSSDKVNIVKKFILIK